MSRINITIDDKSLDELDKQAKTEGRSRSGHIRELVKMERERLLLPNKKNLE